MLLSLFFFVVRNLQTVRLESQLAVPVPLTAMSSFWVTTLRFTLTAHSASMLWEQENKQHWSSLLSTDPLLTSLAAHRTWQWLSRLGYSKMSRSLQNPTAFSAPSSTPVAWLTEDRGGGSPPWQAKCKKSGPRLAYISVFNIFLVFSRLLFFAVCGTFLGDLGF